MNLKVDPSVILRAFGPDGEECFAFLGKLLLDNEPGIPPVLRLCVDWDGHTVHRGMLYPAYLDALSKGKRTKFHRWWDKLTAKDAIDPVNTPTVSDLKSNFPDWKEYEYILIGLAKKGGREERAVVVERHTDYTPTYDRAEIVQRLTEDAWQIRILTVQEAIKHINESLSLAFKSSHEPGYTQLPQSLRVSLLGRIKEYFSIEELVSELCNPLQIPHEEIVVSGAGKETAVRKIVEYCERRPPAIRELVAQCKLMRPGVRWPQLPY